MPQLNNKFNLHVGLRAEKVYGIRTPQTFIILSAAGSCVCVCVCVHVSMCVIVCCEQSISERYKRIFMKFSGDAGRGRPRNTLDFGGDPDSFLDPGSFSSILHH